LKRYVRHVAPLIAPANDYAGSFNEQQKKGKMIHWWIEVFSSRRKKT
jgi:hypothetical protein